MLFLPIKKKTIFYIIHFGAFIFFIFGCNSNNNNYLEVNSDKKQNIYQTIKEPLIKINKNTIRNEEQEINDYISRHHYQNMKISGTGLRYMICKKGNGKINVKNDAVVKLNYTVGFLNGNACYSSSIDGPLIFQIGKAQVESGLEEGVKMLKEGDKAIFIIPYLLAYGMIGDGDRIPAGATLVYNVELLEIK